MVRAMRKLGENLKLVDVVVEAIDARLVHSGANPTLERLIGRKPRIVVLTRADLAEHPITKRWLAAFKERAITALAVDAREQRAVGRIGTLLAGVATKPHGTLRAMVVGIPNSGKSTIVNGLLHRRAAKIENRAGVTRRTQWFRLSPDVELMDTPGVLVPKITTKSAQWKLAAIGAVPRERYEAQEVAANLAHWLANRSARRAPSLEAFAAERGFLRRGGKVDEHNAAQSYLRAFDEGQFGRISLESPDESETA